MEGDKPGGGNAASALRWLLRGAVLGLALVVGLVTWLATRDDGEEPAPSGITPHLTSPNELRSLAATSGRPVYWAGAIAGSELEVAEEPDGGVRVSYPEEGAAAAEGSAAVLTVGTYPLPDPAGSLASYAEQPGAIVRRARDGTTVVTSGKKPTSAYFSSPDNSVQVEVYDPSPKRALGLALSGRVRPAG